MEIGSWNATSNLEFPAHEPDSVRARASQQRAKATTVTMRAAITNPRHRPGGSRGRIMGSEDAQKDISVIQMHNRVSLVALTARTISQAMVIL